MAAVLILEDEPCLRTAIRYYLEMAGFRVFEAASAAEAIVLLRCNRIDCLVSDYYIECGTVHALRHELHRKPLCIPLIIVSGVSPQPDTTLNIYAWLPKPVDFTALERTVRRACSETSKVIDSAG